MATKKITVCLNCGEENLEKAKICTLCGKRRLQEKLVEVIVKTPEESFVDYFDSNLKG